MSRGTRGPVGRAGRGPSGRAGTGPGRSNKPGCLEKLLGLMVLPVLIAALCLGACRPSRIPQDSPRPLQTGRQHSEVSR